MSICLVFLVIKGFSIDITSNLFVGHPVRGSCSGPGPGMVQHDRRAILQIQSQTFRGCSAWLQRWPDPHQYVVGNSMLHPSKLGKIPENCITPQGLMNFNVILSPRLSSVFLHLNFTFLLLTLPALIVVGYCRLILSKGQWTYGPALCLWIVTHKHSKGIYP